MSYRRSALVGDPHSTQRLKTLQANVTENNEKNTQALQSSGGIIKLLLLLRGKKVPKPGPEQVACTYCEQ